MKFSIPLLNHIDIPGYPYKYSKAKLTNSNTMGCLCVIMWAVINNIITVISLILDVVFSHIMKPDLFPHMKMDHDTNCSIWRNYEVWICIY